MRAKSVDWERVARASLHLTRIRILDCFKGKPLSPVMIAERIAVRAHLLEMRPSPAFSW